MSGHSGHRLGSTPAKIGGRAVAPLPPHPHHDAADYKHFTEFNECITVNQQLNSSYKLQYDRNELQKQSANHVTTGRVGRINERYRDNASICHAPFCISVV